jgi:DNA-binding CsgD family transcriptional regulator
LLRPSHGGAIDLIDSGFILAVGVFNLINQIAEGKDIIARSWYTVPFLVIALFLHWIPFKKQFKSIFFLVSGVFVHILAPNPSDFSAVVFFIIAYSEIPQPRYGIIVLIASFGAVAYKAAIIGDSIPQGFAMAVLFGCLYARYYIRHFRGQELKFNDNDKPLTKQQKELMRLHMKGKPRKEIGSMLGLSEDQLYHRYKAIKKIYNVETLEQVTVILLRAENRGE